MACEANAHRALTLYSREAHRLKKNRAKRTMPAAAGVSPQAGAALTPEGGSAAGSACGQRKKIAALPHRSPVRGRKSAALPQPLSPAPSGALRARCINHTAPIKRRYDAGAVVNLQQRNPRLCRTALPRGVENPRLCRNRCPPLRRGPYADGSGW
jgi:hypothetical protein